MSVNFSNRTMWTGDCLDIMRGMNSECVDLIYLDPPFNSKANYAAPIGSKAAGAAFKDTWGLDDIKLVWHGEIKHEYPGLYSLLTTTREIHGASMMSYLIYMGRRIMEIKRLLKPNGSVYLHCDPTASHYLKLLMDDTFGKENFRNEIVWAYTGPGSPKMRQFNRKHDVIFWYSQGEQWAFNKENIRLPYASSTVARGQYDSASPVAGGGMRDTNRGKVPEDWWNDVPSGGQISRNELVGYPTQKPLALLDRIIRASSEEGDLVLDPFCGCATACVAAERLNRQWVGIDLSPKAAELVVMRIEQDNPLLFTQHPMSHRTDIPHRTDLGDIPKYNCAENRRYLYGEQGGYCNGCEEHFTPRHLEVDHIIPLAKGGNDHISNLQLLCSSCNRVKGVKSQEELIRLLTDKGWIKRRKERA